MSNVEEKTGDATVVVSSSMTTTTIGTLTKPTSQLRVVDDTPRILGNELLVKPQTRTSIDHLDELFSLEREIAKMHNVEESVESTTEAVSNSPCDMDNIGDSATVGNSSNNDDRNSNESCGNKYEVEADPIALGETALEHEDLIAVLKGLDDAHNTSDDAELLEGVTIEGEGEYQIMEVVDDDYSAPEPQASTILTVKSGNAAKMFGAAVLTTEEERALALEQIECLKNKQKPRRRKQDIKPMQQVDPVMDLVSSLEAEWTDNDDDVNKEPLLVPMGSTIPTNANKKEAPATVQINDAKPNTPQITSVVVITPSSQNPNSNMSTSVSIDTRNINSAAIDSESNEVVTSSSPLDGVIVRKTDESQVLSTNSGFRRTRIIKRKIIWDPDAPETTFSYAKLVTSSKAKVKPEVSIPTTTITKGSTTIRPIKKEAPTIALKKTSRPATPKDKKIDTDTVAVAAAAAVAVAVDKKSIISRKQSASACDDDEADSKTLLDSSSSSSSPVADILPPNKRRAQTPVANGPGGAKKKKVSEIDRLMGDEGAVNMLNSLEKLEATLGVAETKSTRPMMRSRAATICEKIPRKETTSPVKTPPPNTNQQTNRGGKRTPKPRPSSSWDYVYKQKQKNIDDSMIIRRRSNSSYSSTASLNRLSLDGQSTPTNGPSSSSKVHESKSAPASTTSQNVSSKTASRTSEETPTSSLYSKSAGAGSKNTQKSFEFAKPENKKAQRRTKSPAGTLTSDLKKPAPVANKRNVRSPANMTTTDDKADGGSPSKSPPSTGVVAKEKTHISDVVVKKSSKVTQIIFSTNKAKLSYTFTTQMLNKLSDILDKLAADPDTHVTVMTTNDAHFCQGIDLAELALGSAEKRRNAVKQLAAAVKNYIKTLASFPKPLIAGVNGHVMNLGVMQLAFFDIVVAGDKCTYETPYAKMGQVPEGYSVWNGLNKIRGSFKTKLFWLSEKIQSTEAALAGLVNKLTTGNKVNEEALSIAKRIATMSPESYRVMKKTISSGYFDVVDSSSFDEEFTTIAEQWSSSEFLDNIKKYIDQGHF